MKSLNIRFLVVSSLARDLPQWASVFDAAQFLPGLVEVRAVYVGRDYLFDLFKAYAD